MIDRMIAWSIAMMFSEPFLTYLNWLFSKLTQVQRRAKYCHLSKPHHIHVQVVRSANARATPLEQWKSNLSKSSSMAWVIAKRESWAEKAEWRKMSGACQRREAPKVQRGARMPGQRRAGKLVYTVKSLFSAPALIYFNPCRTTGAKRRTALKRGRRLIFERQIMDLRL